MNLFVPRMDGEPPPKAKLTKAEKKAKYRTDYTEPIKSRREALKAIMNGPERDRERKARAKNCEFFDEDYRSGVNIYGMAVDMMNAMPDRGKTVGQSLAVWYLEDFGNWLRDSGKEEKLREKYLESTIQLAALNACTTAQKTLLCEIFNISQERLIEDVTQLIDSSLKKNDFANAAELALQHNLASNYTLEDIALPLILRGRDQLAYKIMDGHTEIQKELVKFLDQMVDLPEVKVEDILKPYIEYKILTVPVTRFTGKTLDKLISHVLTKNTGDYHFDNGLAKYAPNFSMNGDVKTLKHNIIERYSKERSDENYFQHMVHAFKVNPKVREGILFFLWDSDNREKQVDAISLAIHFGINNCSSDQIPGKMKDFFRSPDSRLREAEDLLKRRQTMQLPCRSEQIYVYEDQQQHPIYMVTNESEFNKLCTELKSLNDEPHPVYVGFDSEWKPSNLISPNSSKIAIIQLFFKNCVWLVDCVELEEEKIEDKFWVIFADRLFKSPKLKVIGFDMRNDLDAIITIPALKGVLKIDEIGNAYDLKRLAENVCDIDMEILELPKKTFKLADLTQHLIGLKLDKTEQCSNWQCRPLRKNQIIYAALDAVVVVETFKRILELTLEKDETVDAQKIETESNVLAPKKDKGQKNHKKLKTIRWLELYEILRNHRDPRKHLKRPQDIQVIVDTMLLGFGKHLRRVGIDVYLPRDIRDFREKLRLMNRLGGEYQRTIVTVPSKSYEALKVDYERYTLALPDLNNKSPIDQLIAFFDKFNVDIRPEDEYLRCIECNSRLQIKFPGPVLHFLHQYSVIHVQNVYRADMSEFPLQEWWNRMLEINPDDYDGIKVEMSRPTPRSKWIVATVPTGCLHITRQTAIHTNLPDGVEVRIEKVPDDEFQRPNLCFYICGDCGTVAYDGRSAPISESYSNEYVA